MTSMKEKVEKITEKVGGKIDRVALFTNNDVKNLHVEGAVPCLSR